VPDEWENNTLNSFENGEKLVFEFTQIHGKPFLRYMKAIEVTKECFKCHNYRQAYKGRKAGDVGGGISISLPMEPFIERQNSQMKMNFASFGGIWLLGITGILSGFFGIRRRIEERDHAQAELRRSQGSLIEEQKRALEIQAGMTNAFSRFVPKEFLEYLNRDSIVDVKLGDQTLEEMTILFSDIRHFATLSETMTPQENFSFINSYLERTGPVIRAHKGFIDKYIGDAVMALFPGNPENALDAAIALQKEVSRYNMQRRQAGWMEITIGAGLHYGKLMLGTIGEENRMETTVISDSVNLASRLESLTKMYNAKIIVSSDLLKNVENYEERYSLRFLDKVRVKGKNEPVSVYEIMDSLSPGELELKLRTKSDFLKGVSLYQKAEIAEAVELFRQVVAVNESDLAAHEYISRCEYLIRNGIPEEWDSILTLDLK
jgi:class 3 adenylate cyclase